MEQLFAPSVPRRRSPAGTAISAGLHLAIALGGAAVTHATVDGTPQRPLTSITFLISAVPPALASAPMRQTAADAAASLRPSPPLDPSDARVEPVHVAEPEPAIPALPEPAAPELPAAADALIASPNIEAPRPPVTVGAFERAQGQEIRGSARAVASVAGFNRADAVPRATAPAGGAVRNAGFDLAAPASPAAAPPAAARVDRIDTPVEILFKPEPRYTDEARTLRIEGTVVLEVEFGAAGDLRVLHMVSGLGHGLDEAAAHAAEQIRFKPARGAGIAVDVRTTVRIVFRLT